MRTNSFFQMCFDSSKSHSRWTACLEGHISKGKQHSLGIKHNIPIFMAATINILGISRGKKRKANKQQRL